MPRACPLPNIGDNFGSWLVTGPSYTRRMGRLMRRVCPVVCSCGTTKTVTLDSLRRRLSTQCHLCGQKIASGVRHSEARKLTAGEAAAYRSWVAARSRCRNPKDASYTHYGARGIHFSRLFDTFEDFLAHAGPRPPGTSLDRIDNNGHYAPGNIRWADAKVQRANQRKRAVAKVLQELGV